VLAGTELPSGFQATDLPPGHHDVSFNLAIATAGPSETPVLCAVGDSRREFAAVALGVGHEGESIVDGSGSTTVEKTGEAQLVCRATGELEHPAADQFRNTLTFTRVQAVHQGGAGSLSAHAVKQIRRKWSVR
jgi:hypothetical protein